MAKYPEREGRQIELKQDLSGFDSLLKTIVAFLNDIGGLIAIGVVDQSREILGLTELQIEDYLERIPQAIADAIEPRAPVSIRTRTFESATIIEIEIYPGTRKPYFIKSEGIPKGVFVRLGSHTKRASNEQIDELILAGRGIPFDSEPVPGVTLSDLDPHLLKQFYRGSIPDIATLRADKLIILDPVTKQDLVTIAGVVLLHPDPHTVFPAAEVLFTSFKGKTTDEIIRTVDISAPLATTTYQLMNLIEPLTVIKTKRSGAKLESSKFTIPPLAIREALLNALIHRRYSANAPIKIAMFEDRIEIFSPGNFPGPIDLDELGSGVSYYRNSTIANFARRIGLVERRGLGFTNIIQSCRANLNTPPQIIEGSDFVKVTLYSSRQESFVSLPAELSALESLREKRIPLTTSKVRELLQVSSGTARARIMQLVDLGLVKQEGLGRAVRYGWRG